jgi:tripartite-type tricarboxylate transporter receptor subunit TctC
VRSFIGANDDHTLLYSFSSIVTVNPVLHASLPYDPAKDLLPLARVADDFICIVAAPQSGIATLSDLEHSAQKSGRDLTYASFPGAPYLVFQMFQKKIGADMTFVPYRAMPAALHDLVQNRVQVGVLSLAFVQELARAEKLKLLAVASKERAPGAPGIPTTQEAAHPELLVMGGHGLFARSNMAAELRERVARDALELLAEPQLRERIVQAGFVPRGEGPAEFRAFLESEARRLRSLAGELGARAHVPNSP